MYKPVETKLQTNEPAHVNPAQDSGTDFEDVDVYEKFESHRCAANNYLRTYFECFIHHQELPGLNRRSLNPQGQRPRLMLSLADTEIIRKP